jgi:hypothetical protein
MSMPIYDTFRFERAAYNAELARLRALLKEAEMMLDYHAPAINADVASLVARIRAATEAPSSNEEESK